MSHRVQSDPGMGVPSLVTNKEPVRPRPSSFLTSHLSLTLQDLPRDTATQMLAVPHSTRVSLNHASPIAPSTQHCWPPTPLGALWVTQHQDSHWTQENHEQHETVPGTEGLWRGLPSAFTSSYVFHDSLEFNKRKTLRLQRYHS